MSMSLRPCLNDIIEGAWRRLKCNEFHASTFLQRKDDRSTLDALGGLRKYGECDLDDSMDVV